MVSSIARGCVAAGEEVAMGFCLPLLALLLFEVPGGTVSGKVLDREGKPLANAQVTYTNIGTYTETGATGRIQGGISSSGTGKVYKTKTNKKGEFLILAVSAGFYQVEVNDPTGFRIYRTKAAVADNGDKTSSNVLNIDLSTRAPGDIVITDPNSLAAKMNPMVTQARSALEAHDWTTAADLLRQLIAMDPNRWEFYQNMGTIQANREQYEDAIASYRKAVELLEKSLNGASNPVKVKTDLSGIMISEGDALNRLNKLDDATALYQRAAELAPQPAMAYFHACNAQSNRGTPASAIDFCTKAIAADPSHWEFYQVMARTLNSSGKAADAIATYEKGEQLARDELAAKPDSSDSSIVKNGLGQMLTAEGNIYAQQNKYDQAITAFAESAKISSYAALPYFNLCAIYYDSKRLEEAVTACDQAIASDPTMSEAYYIKAVSLFGKGTLAAGKYAPPEEARVALNKYLELSPFGEHAHLVREMIDKLNEAMDTDTAAKPRKTVKK
jgi:tetratricopeptide (TPR) repeat protein